MTSPLGPMFHGTVHPFKEGDIVSPEYDESGEGEAHATDLLNAAKSFGKHVFEVEPLDPSDLDEHYLSHKGVSGTHYTSQKGFKVIKQVK